MPGTTVNFLNKILTFQLFSYSYGKMNVEQTRRSNISQWWREILILEKLKTVRNSLTSRVWMCNLANAASADLDRDDSIQILIQLNNSTSRYDRNYSLVATLTVVYRKWSRNVYCSSWRMFPENQLNNTSCLVKKVSK